MTIHVDEQLRYSFIGSQIATSYAHAIVEHGKTHGRNLDYTTVLTRILQEPEYLFEQMDKGAMVEGSPYGLPPNKWRKLVGDKADLIVDWSREENTKDEDDEEDEPWEYEGGDKRYHCEKSILVDRTLVAHVWADNPEDAMINAIEHAQWQTKDEKVINCSQYLSVTEVEEK